jgi:hypothetical protein
MRVQAEIRSIDNKSGISKKTGKEYSINELYFIDTEAPKPEVLVANVHENDLANVRALVGKTVVCNFFYNSGNIRFGGQVTQAINPKVVNG